MMPVPATLLFLIASSWLSIPVPVQDFYARTFVAWSADEAIFTGKHALYGGAVILRYGDGKLEQVLDTPEGHVAAASTSRDFAWAVLGSPRRDQQPGSEYTLYRSPDRGRTWTIAGIVPFRSVSRLEAVSDTELWIHAAGLLGRSVDGGVTWDVVHAPGDRDPFKERLVATRDQVLLLSERSIRSTDGGESWEPLGVDGKLVAADQGWYLGSHGGRMAVRDPSGVWRPLPWSHERAHPMTLRVVGAKVHVLVSDISQGLQVRWFESPDQGKTWSSGSLRAISHYWAWDIAPDGAYHLFSSDQTTLHVRRD